MKTRLACNLARTWSALRDDVVPRHAATCADCQAYFRTQATLDATLRHTAGSALPAAPANLDRDILAAVRRSRAPEPVHTRSYSWGSLGALGTLAAAIAVGAIVFNRPAKAPEFTASDAQSFVKQVAALSSDFTERVLPNAGALVADNPLQSEITAVYADARTALDFLAMNFLPTSPAKPGNG
ncbi:MAG: hypothetical protein V4773_13580 [Verrucomicrobiota bacterium]